MVQHFLVFKWDEKFFVYFYSFQVGLQRSSLQFTSKRERRYETNISFKSKVVFVSQVSLLV